MNFNTGTGRTLTRKLITVTLQTPLRDAWALLRTHRIRALPVVDSDMRVVGIITLADFLRAADLDVYEGFDGKLKKLINATRRIYSKKPEVVEHVMMRNVQVAGMQQHLVDLVPLFGTTGHHHIPILDEEKKLVGIITQSNLVAALGRAADPTT